MTITNLRVKNFKSWRDTGDMRLAPMTALFGTNSSGKTGLLHLLLMLKQTAESPDRGQALNLGDGKGPVELGTFVDILHGRKSTGEISFEVGWTLQKETVFKVSDTNGGEVSLKGKEFHFEATVGLAGQKNGELERAETLEFRYQFGGQRFGMRRTKKGEKAGYELIEEGAPVKLARRRGRPWDLPAPVKFYVFPDRVWADYPNAGFLSDLILEFQTLCARIMYLGPLREYPRRQYTWGGASPNDVGWRGERVVDALLAARSDPALMLPRGKGKPRVSIETRVAEWLKDLGLIDAFNVREVAKGSSLYQVWVRRDAASPEVLITDVGFGVSQILPVIALCYYAPQGATLVLEQPEIHLHPSVQMGLADVFIDAIKTRKIQIVLESHSEHLLKRLQRRIAEGALESKDTALYFCTMAGGESQREELKLDKDGNITNWPKDFFGDQFGEIAAMSEAALERQS
jgi:predicted ATPase